VRESSKGRSHVMRKHMARRIREKNRTRTFFLMHGLNVNALLAVRFRANLSRNHRAWKVDSRCNEMISILSINSSEPPRTKIYKAIPSNRSTMLDVKKKEWNFPRNKLEARHEMARGLVFLRVFLNKLWHETVSCS